MQEEEYKWVLGAFVAYRQQFDEEPDDPLSRAMQEVTGLMGRLRHHERQAANEALVAALLLLLIYAWTCAKYRVRIGVFDKNGAIYLQKAPAAFFATLFPETLVLWALHERGGFFLEPDRLCQINTPLTI